MNVTGSGNEIKVNKQIKLGALICNFNMIAHVRDKSVRFLGDVKFRLQFGGFELRFQILDFDVRV